MNNEELVSSSFINFKDYNFIKILMSVKPKQAYKLLKYGDTIRIEAKGADGQSVFGAIDQKIAPLQKA